MLLSKQKIFLNYCALDNFFFQRPMRHCKKIHLGWILGGTMLPFKANVGQLAESHEYALKHLLSQERILAKNSNYTDQYNALMKEYEEPGHMSEDINANVINGNYLAHHSVTKQSSLTTKLREIFYASAKTSTGLSLNDTFMVAPNVQDGLFSLIVLFRTCMQSLPTSKRCIGRKRCTLMTASFKKSCGEEIPISQ